MVFSGCSTGGGGSNPPDDNTPQEAVKWTKVTQLGRQGIVDKNKFSATSYNSGLVINDGYIWKLENCNWI